MAGIFDPTPQKKFFPRGWGPFRGDAELVVISPLLNGELWSEDEAFWSALSSALPLRCCIGVDKVHLGRMFTPQCPDFGIPDFLP